MCKRAVFIPLVWLLSCLPTVAAGAVAPETQIEVHWSELSVALAGGRVALVLPDGTVLQGEAVEVKTDELLLDISKSSERRAYPKGRRWIPRSAITTVRLTKTRGVKGRIIGTIAGFAAAGALLGAARIENLDNEVSGWVALPLLAVAIGVPVSGYYAGRSFDRKTTLIKVLPD